MLDKKAGSGPFQAPDAHANSYAAALIILVVGIIYEAKDKVRELAGAVTERGSMAINKTFDQLENITTSATEAATAVISTTALVTTNLLLLIGGIVASLLLAYFTQIMRVAQVQHPTGPLALMDQPYI